MVGHGQLDVGTLIWQSIFLETLLVHQKPIEIKVFEKMQRRFKVPSSNNLSVADLGGAWGDRPMSTTKEIVFSQWKGLKISLYYFWVAIKHILWSESLHLHYLAPYKKKS